MNANVMVRKGGELVNLWEWLRTRWPYSDTLSAYEERMRNPPTKNEFLVTEEEMNASIGADVATPLRRLQPGDILDVITKLRKLMSSYETTAYTLFASFEDLGDSALEEEAAKVRHTLELAATRITGLLILLEKTPHYTELRRETLARRKERYRPKDK